MTLYTAIGKYEFRKYKNGTKLPIVGPTASKQSSQMRRHLKKANTQ